MAFYFSKSEIKNSFGGLKYIHPYMVDMIDYIRSDIANPIMITSITRTLEKQEILKKQGATNVLKSPHLAYIWNKEKIEIYDPKKDYSDWGNVKIHSFAIDVLVPEVFKNGEDFKNYIRNALKIRDIRIGWWQYMERKQNFIHLDCAYILPEDLKEILSPAIKKHWQPRVEW